METLASLLFTCSLLCLIPASSTQAVKNLISMIFTAFATGLPLSRRSPHGFGEALHLRRGRLGCGHPGGIRRTLDFLPLSKVTSGLAPPCGRGTSASSTLKEPRRSLPPANFPCPSPPFAKRSYNKRALLTSPTLDLG